MHQTLLFLDQLVMLFLMDQGRRSLFLHEIQQESWGNKWRNSEGISVYGQWVWTKLSLGALSLWHPHKTSFCHHCEHSIDDEFDHIFLLCLDARTLWNHIRVATCDDANPPIRSFRAAIAQRKAPSLKRALIRRLVDQGIKIRHITTAWTRLWRVVASVGCRPRWRSRSRNETVWNGVTLPAAQRYHLNRQEVRSENEALSWLPAKTLQDACLRLLASEIYLVWDTRPGDVGGVLWIHQTDDHPRAANTF